MIRFNSQLNRYEGHNGTAWIRLGGISDVAGNTYILPESSPGANDNTLYFYTNGSLTATLDANTFTVPSVVVDNFNINGNVISTTALNTDIQFSPNGTGAVVIDNLKFSSSTITNTAAGGVTELRSTGTGYVKIAGTYGVVIPSGDVSGRPITGVLGMIRYNTQLSRTEIFDGASWVSVAGTSGGVNEDQANEIGLTSALIFG
jgi:hypothetical protein